MANPYDQNRPRSDYQSDQRRNEPLGRSDSTVSGPQQQRQGAGFGDDDHACERSDHPRGGDYGRQEGRDEGRWAHGGQGEGRQAHPDSPFSPPSHAGARGRDEQGGVGRGDGNSDGSEAGSGLGGYGQGGGYAQSSYGQRGSYNQGGFQHRDFGQGGFGQGGSGPGRSGQDDARPGAPQFDQGTRLPYRASYDGGYGEEHSGGRGRSRGDGRYGQQEFDHARQGVQESGPGGYRQSGRTRGEDGPSEASYLGDSDRGNWARGYVGEGRGGSSAMGYSARGQGGSGYAEHSGSAGNPTGGSHRGMGPRGYTRSDERLCEHINERLTDDDHIDASDISVAVKDGVVTLSGEVDERRLKHRIEDMVEACHGVQDIRNEIRVKRGGSGRSGARAGSAEGSSVSTGGSSGSASTASGGPPAASAFSGSASSTAGGSSSSGPSGGATGSDDNSASGGIAGQSGLSSGQRIGIEDSSRADSSATFAASRKK